MKAVVISTSFWELLSLLPKLPEGYCDWVFSFFTDAGNTYLSMDGYAFASSLDNIQLMVRLGDDAATAKAVKGVARDNISGTPDELRKVFATLETGVMYEVYTDAGAWHFSPIVEPGGTLKPRKMPHLRKSAKSADETGAK